MSHPILIVGHYCHDTLYLANGSCSEALGGSVSYISTVLKGLGVDCQVISKVGEDFLYSSKIHHTPQRVSGFPTTRYISDFTRGERIGRVGARCESIFPKDLPSAAFPDSIAIAAGIVGEVLPETLQSLAFKSKFLLCDIQGLIRKFDAVGQVSLQPLSETAFYPFLNLISFLKVSRAEADFIDIEEVRQKTTLLITEGELGCTVYLKYREFSVPAFRANELDPSGAGDCFLAGFAAGLQQGLLLDEAVRMGNYYGSLAVEQVGVPRVIRKANFQN